MQAELQEAVDALQRQYRRRPVKRLREAGIVSSWGLPWTKLESRSRLVTVQPERARLILRTGVIMTDLKATFDRTIFSDYIWILRLDRKADAAPKEETVWSSEDGAASPEAATDATGDEAASTEAAPDATAAAASGDESVKAVDKAAKVPASEFKPLPNHEFKKGDSILLLRADDRGELIDDGKASTCPHAVMTCVACSVLSNLT